MKLNPRGVLILVFSGLSLTFLLGLYGYHFRKESFSNDTSDWGDFGSYIGGILGVIFTGITIYLLYETYRTQNDQLNIQKRDSDINYLTLQYDQIVKDIEDISFKGKRGSDALYSWDETHIDNPNNVVDTLNFILHIFKDHIAAINSNEIIDVEIKRHFLARAYLMFHSKIIWPVLAKLYDDTSFRDHTDNLCKHFNDMIREAYIFLVEKQKLKYPNDSRIVAVLSNKSIL
jgi:hypothetical protein